MARFESVGFVMTIKVLTPESLVRYDQTKNYLNKESADSLYVPKDTFAISAIKSGSVTTLTLKDESGTHITTINDGIKGDQGIQGVQGVKGDPGNDGFTPTITSSKSGSITTLTITNKNGTSTATINDGVKGDTGLTGPQGPPGTDCTAWTYVSQTSTANLQPKKIYYLGTISSAFSYTLASGNNGDQWCIGFTCGSTAVEITHPSGVKVGDFKVVPNVYNELHILQTNGMKYLVGKGWEN